MPPPTKMNIAANDRLNTNNLAEFTHRERVAAADVTAGYTLLPAVPGYKYRVTNIAAIAIGGAAAGATDIRVLGTQGGSPAALAVVPVAVATQNTLVTLSTATVAILAGGASFVENDVNTPITIGKTGAALSGSSAIDVILSYQLTQARVGA